MSWGAQDRADQGARHELAYRPEIDGLRGIAVLLVVAFHLGLPDCRGGYVGVDVFFVISGYLITQIVLKGLREGTFTYGGFYLRRTRRIFPALFAMLLACTVIALALYPPLELRAYGGLLWKVALFSGNIGFAHLPFTGGYFDSSVRPSVLQHTWSLAVEEQFYLLYPLLLVSLARWRRRMVLPVLLVLWAISFGMSLWWTQADRTAAYYLLPSRSWELLTGAVLAAVQPSAIRSRPACELVSLAGLGMIATAAYRFHYATPFPGYAAALPVAGAALLLWAGQGPSATAALLRSRPAVSTGLISYSLYLWHWPLRVLTQYLLCLPPNYGLSSKWQVELFVLSLALATASYWLVERPFRGGASRVSDTTMLVLALATVVLTAALGWGFVTHHGVPRRFPHEVAARLNANTLRRVDSPGFGQCLNGDQPLPSFAKASFCRFGDRPTNVLLWGDSHAWHLLPLFRTLEAKDELRGRGIVTAFAVGCPPARHLNLVDPGKHCDQAAQFSVQRALQPDIDTVFIQFLPWWTADEVLCLSENGRCARRLPAQEAQAAFLADLAASIELLKSHGKRVILGTPFPVYAQDVPDVEIRRQTLGRWAHVATPTLQPETWRETLRDLGRAESIPVFDPRSVLCDDGGCRYAVDGVSLLRDNNHIAASQLEILHPALLAALSAGAGEP